MTEIRFERSSIWVESEFVANLTEIKSERSNIIAKIGNSEFLPILLKTARSPRSLRDLVDARSAAFGHLARLAGDKLCEL